MVGGTIMPYVDKDTWDSEYEQRRRDKKRKKRKQRKESNKKKKSCLE